MHERILLFLCSILALVFCSVLDKAVCSRRTKRLRHLGLDEFKITLYRFGIIKATVIWPLYATPRDYESICGLKPTIVVGSVDSRGYLSQRVDVILDASKIVSGKC